MSTIGEEAARWLCELREDDRRRQAEFSAWLRRSPQHVEEFLFATTMWRKLKSFGDADPARVERMIAAAAEAGRAGANVVELERLSAHTAALPPGKLSSARWAAAAALVAGLAAAVWMYATRAPTYDTGIGEQRIVRLDDGSRVDLNTRSRIAIRYSGTAREIALLEGEALFTVAGDSRRPFRVTSGATVVQALGTQFNVYRHGEDTRVSVVEGAVRVAESTELTAGEEAQVSSAGRVLKQASPDVARSVAWRERRLVFRADPLETVAAEVSRYSGLSFEIEDAAARELKLTAIFDTDDPMSLVRFLERMDSLVLHQDGNRVMVRSRRETRETAP